MCTKLQLNVNLFPVICCLLEVNTFCGRTRLKIVSSVYFNVEIFRRIASSDHGFTTKHYPCWYGGGGVCVCVCVGGGGGLV